MAAKDYNDTIRYWITALKQYSFSQLSKKPAPNSWSMGQVYMHLLDTTHFHIDQMKICLATDDNKSEEAFPEAKAMFRSNSFPDEIIEGPPENDVTPQALNKEELVQSMDNLRKEINVIGDLISKTRSMGKTRHPGLNYFNAKEWFQFSEMHFRHHLRQKKRIDTFLERSKEP